MNIQKIILGTLGLQLTACGKELTPSTGQCDEYDFTLSTDVTITPFMFSDTSTVSSCEDLCSIVYEYESMADVRSVATCETSVNLEDLNNDLLIDEQIEDSGDTGEEKVYGTVDCTGTAMPFCMGRRPMGHIEHQSSKRDLGNYFANCAYLEAASVDAFIELAEQLRSWGAPEDLIQRCLVAAEEEQEHTLLMDTLSKTYGGNRPEPSADPQSNTTLFEVALHNAVEGCVQEAWAACVATHQCLHADESLKAIFAQIAKDEIEHAQLSWDLHRWLCTQLCAEEQRQIQQAQDEAIRRLQTQASTRHPDTDFLGLCVPEKDLVLRRRFTERLAA